MGDTQAWILSISIGVIAGVYLLIFLIGHRRGPG